MTKDEDFKLLKIQTVVLKVNIHCDGCKLEVKKLLQKIEGVYTVHIDAEHQKVTVSGNVDSATLIKRLARSGKHAELWSQKPAGQNKQHNQQQQQQQHPQLPSALKLGGKNAKDQQKQNLMKGLQAFKNQHKKAPSFSSDEDDGDEEDDDDDDAFDDLAFLGNKINLLASTNAAAAAAANAPKNPGGGNNVGNGNHPGGGKKKGGGGGGGGNPNPNQMKHHPNGSDQKGANHHPGAGAGGKMAGAGHMGANPNPGHGPGKMGHPMAGLGLNGLGFPQAQQQPGLGFPQGQQHPGLGFPQAQQQPGLGFHGHTGAPQPGLRAVAGGGAGGFGGPAHQQQPSPMMMNLQGHPSMMMGPTRPGGMMMAPDAGRYMQAQMMYHRSPQVTPYTGYYPYYQPPPPSYYYHPNQHQSEGSDYGAHLFSDENTHSCAVM